MIARRDPEADRGASLRRRLLAWTLTIVGATVGLLTAAALHEELRALRRLEAAHADAWLRHLAGMPDLQGPRADVEEQLAAVSRSLRAVDAELILSPAGPASTAPGDEAVVAVVELPSTGGEARALVYRRLPGRALRLGRRTVAGHVALGIAAVLGLVAATDWLLRRRLVSPVRDLARQLAHMGSRGGWQPRLGEGVDRELQPLWDAIGALGPGLEGQVRQWVEAERRAAVALALSTVCRAMRDPLRDCAARASALQAQGALGPDSKRLVRALVRSIDRAQDALRRRSRATFAAQALGNRETGEARAEGPRVSRRRDTFRGVVSGT